MKKSWFLVRVLLIVALLGVVIASPAQAEDEKLAMFGGNPQHTGVSLEQGPQSEPQVLWKVATGGKVTSSPAVAGGKVFAGSYDGSLYAVDQASGNVVWTFKTGAQVKSSPAVWNNTVYFSSSDGNFYAVHANDGKLRWSFKTNDANTSYYEQGIPWFVDGIDPIFYAMTGEQRFDRINDPWDNYYSSPTIDKGMVYFGAYDGSLYALKANDGKLVWQFESGAPVRSTPAIAYGLVFFGNFAGNFYAVDANTGLEKWQIPYVYGEWNTANIQGSAAVADGMVYFGGRDTYQHAVDAQTGETKWLFSHDGSWVISTPAVDEGVVYSGSSDGLFVNALDSKTGQQIWRFPTIHNVFASPVIAGDTLYIGDFDGYQVANNSLMYALDAKTGTLKWQFATEGTSSTVAVDQGTLYFGTESGYIMALQ